MENGVVSGSGRGSAMVHLLNLCKALALTLSTKKVGEEVRLRDKMADSCWMRNGIKSRIEPLLAPYYVWV